ncbi:MAG: acylphosphatase, partial [Chthoniobacteraceae bacterium]
MGDGLCRECDLAGSRGVPSPQPRSLGMTARQVYYEGRVQGVGFRYSCINIARGYDLAGWVRNLSDGRVELQCSGETDEV